MTPGTFGPPSRTLLAVFDPAASCWRTFGGIFPSDGMPSLRTWPEWGTASAGELCGHPTPVRLTNARACSPLLPTPRANDSHGTGIRGTGGLDLPTAVVLLPTPTATDASGAQRPRDRARNGREGYGPALRDIPYLLGGDHTAPRSNDGNGI
jgi:hypothetical protein